MASSKPVERKLLGFTVVISISSVCLSLFVILYFVFTPNTCTCDLGKEIDREHENATKNGQTVKAEARSLAVDWTDSSSFQQTQRNRRENRAVDPNANYYFDTLTKVQQNIIVLQTRTQYMQQELSRLSSMGHVAGRSGPPGIPGRNGAEGRPGLNGPVGPPGRDGPSGKDGHPGPPGTPGAPGVNGIPGLQGLMGPKGKKGEHGEPGESGKIGLKGSQGMPGMHGDDGEPGYPGRRGDRGKKGDKGEATCYVTEQGRRVPKPCDLVLLDVGQSRGKKERSGAVSYIRWGRSTCPTRAERVYRGQAAATRHGDPRTGGSPFICLPNQPWYFGQVNLSTPLVNDSNQPQRPQHDRKTSPLYGTSFYMTCAVCVVKTRSVQVMLPARKECDRGWTREYDGFLAVSSNRRSDQDLICIDRDGRSLLRDARFARALYADCGTLPCPPYAADEGLPCVVCSM